MPTTKPYRILTLDGGGICGLLTAIVLDRLETAHPGFLASVDLFAGTSTGGILALGLAAGLSPLEIADLYDARGREVFDDSAIDNLLDLGNAIGAKYGNQRLRALLAEKLGARTLGDLPRKVLVAAFDLDNGDDPKRKPGSLRTWKPKFFHNFDGDGSDKPEAVVEVAMRTSAAPTYFPVYRGYIDGGVAANNPSMCAVAQVLHEDLATLKNIHLLSLGTGDNERYLPAEKVFDSDWGWAQWATQLPGIMVSANVGVAHYQCLQILGEDRYRRINPRLPRDVDLDSVAEIPVLKQTANDYDLTEDSAWLQASWMAPAKPPKPKPAGSRNRR